MTAAHSQRPLPDRAAEPPEDAAPPLDALYDMTLPVVIEFGRSSMTLQDVLALGPGETVQLDRMVGDPVDIYVSDRKLAEGEVVVVGEYFGVRITRLANGTGATARA